MTPLEQVGVQIIELEAKIADLEAELANRPVVWAIERIKEKKLVKRFGAVMLFQTKEDVEEYIPTGFIYPFEWQAVIYKGEARWSDNSRQADPPPVILSPLSHIELTLVIPTTKDSLIVGPIVTEEDEKDE